MPYEKALVAAVLLASIVFLWWNVQAGHAELSWYVMLLSSAAVFAIGGKHHESGWFPPVFFLAVSLLFASQAFINLDRIGLNDWDYNLLQVSVATDSIVKYRQLPLWNPYHCGGNVMIADPQGTSISPLQLATTMFKPVHAVKIAIVLTLLIGLLGSYRLSKHMMTGVYGPYLSSIAYMGAGVFYMHIAEGHVTWLSMCWLPWAFYFFLKSNEDLKYTVFSAAATAMIILGGNVYLAFYTSLFLALYALLNSLINPGKISMRPYQSLVLVFLLTALFAAVKIVPVLEFYTSDYYSDVRTYNSGGFTVSGLFDSLLNRNQGLSHHMAGLRNSNLWPNYGAYMGAIPLVLAALGVFTSRKRTWPLAVALFFFAILALANNSTINLWGLLHDIPVFSSFRRPARMILVVAFCISVFAGLGLKDVERKSRLLALLLVFVVLADLTSVNGRLMKSVSAVNVPGRVAGEFQQVGSGSRIKGSHSGMYLSYLSNKGTVDCYRAVSLPIKAKPGGGRLYLGEAYIVGSTGAAKITSFTNNAVEVAVDSQSPGLLVLNQNYYPGWKSDAGDVKSYNGLISVPVDQSNRTVHFFFQPTSFYLGFAISILTVAAVGVIYLRASG